MKRLALLLLSLATVAFSATLHVPVDHATIQAALDAAQSGDTVLVQPGTYPENIFWPDVNGIKLISAGDSSNTVIDGSGSGNVIYMNPSTATIDSTTEIREFKITNGGGVVNGGGIFINNASPLIHHLWIADNTASEGGGIYISSGNPTIRNVLWTGNDATGSVGDGNGGGLLIMKGNSNLSGIIITQNTARRGGGIYIGGGTPTLLGFIVSNNSADYGAGINIWNSSANLRSGIVSGNTATYAGGFYLRGSSIITDVAVTDNRASINGGGLMILGSPTLTNVIVRRNSAGDGGGFWIEGSPILTKVTATSNIAGADGGGLLVKDNTSTLSDAIVANNSAFRGAGIFIENRGTLTMSNTTVSGNSGEGLYYLYFSGGTLLNSTIVDNTRGIYIESGTPSITGSNIAYQGAGLDNADNSSIIAATNNWWGDPSGPYHPTQNPTGQGDSVNAFVNVTPFLTEPDTVAPPIRIQNLYVTEFGEDLIRLSWDASPIGDLAEYKVYFDTDSSGFPYSDTLDVGMDTSLTLSNLELGQIYYITATCYDTDGNESWYSREVVATVSPVPRIAVSSSTIEFDVTMVGDSGVAALLVSNTGTADLNVGQILSGDPQFVASPGSFTVPVGGQQEVTVSFMPGSYGVVSDTLTIISDAYNDPNLPVLVQGFGDLPEGPVILSIVDVDDPPDQGGHVRITFSRSKYDGLDTTQAITEYSLWRLNEGESWDGVGQFNAVQDSLYNFVAPTLCDSTWEGICWSLFKVSAHTDDPDTFYFSVPDSGYSIDNIAPGVPTGLLAAETDSGVVLTWHPSTETDFQYYAIYRSTQPGFEPDTMELFLFSTADTHFVDTDVQASTTYYYRISAFDYAGNESGFSDETSIIILGVSRDYGIPAEYALHPAYPNPFNPSTTLRFDLPVASEVTMIVYNLLGREVVRLVEGRLEPGHHQVLWDGKTAGGRDVPTGIYIARMSTPTYTRSIKLVLLK